MSLFRTAVQLTIAFLPIVALSGCATHSISAVSTEGYAQAYREREVINESLFTADQALLSNDDINRILEGRISLPDNVRMAILPFGRSRYGSSWHYSVYETVDQESIDAVLSQLIAHDRIAHVSFLPSLMIPDTISITHLRESAARYQANLLLVYRVSTRSYSSYRRFRSDEAHSYAYVEAILLDIRTGIVPFATSSTVDIAVQETGETLTFEETRQQAERAATGRALIQIVDELQRFLSTAP